VILIFDIVFCSVEAISGPISVFIYIFPILSALMVLHCNIGSRFFGGFEIGSNKKQQVCAEVY